MAIMGLGACGGSSGSGSGAIGGGGNTGDFCNALKVDAAKFNEIGNNADEKTVEAALTDLANKAPSEIKGDMTKLVNAIKAFSSFGSELSADPSKAASLESQFSAQEADLTAAEANITKFAKDKCGVDLNSSSSST
jgi:uncharacterized membrane-anchored protein YjiN (DUF445 family)